MTLPMVVRSGVMPKWACAHPLAIRKPVMTSSKQSRAPSSVAMSRRPCSRADVALLSWLASASKALVEAGEGPPP